MHTVKVICVEYLKLFIWTQLNCSKYCYIISIIQFRYTVQKFLIFLCHTNNSIKHQSFVCTQLNGQTVLFDPLTGPYQVLTLRVRVNLGAMTMKGFSIFHTASGQESHHQMQFWIIFTTLMVEESYPPAEMQSVYSTPPAK